MSRRGRGEGSIFKRTDGRWVGEVQHQGAVRRVYGATRQEVMRGLAQVRREIEAGLTVNTERQTVAQYLAGWLEGKRQRLRNSSYVRYEETIRLHVEPTLGRLQVRSVTAQHIERLEAEKLAEGLAPATVARLHVLLSNALRDAERLGVVARNVARLVTPPRARRREMQVLDAEGVRRLLETCASDPEAAAWYPLYALAVTTGMRRGELLALHWDDVDLKRRVVSVRYSLEHITGEGWVIGPPKSESAYRSLTIAHFVAEALRRHRMAQREARVLAGPAWQDVGHGGLVFCTAIGTAISANHLLQRRFRPLLAQAGLPAIRFHDLRHTAATTMLQAGINPKVVQEMLGHSNVSLTLNIYGHVLPNMQADAAAVADSLFGS